MLLSSLLSLGAFGENNIHLMYGPAGNSKFCSPESPGDQDSREEKTN